MTEKSTPHVTDEDLVQLKPDTQSIFVRLIGPKIIILTFLSLIFVSRNLYSLITEGMPQIPQPPEPRQPNPASETITTRMYGYLALTVVLFAVYFCLARINDNALLRQKQEELKRKQQQKQEGARGNNQTDNQSKGEERASQITKQE